MCERADRPPARGALPESLAPGVLECTHLLLEAPSVLGGAPACAREQRDPAVGTGTSFLGPHAHPGCDHRVPRRRWRDPRGAGRGHRLRQSCRQRLPRGQPGHRHRARPHPPAGRNTLQADALKLVAKKLQTTLAVEGELPEDDLAGYGDEGDDLPRPRRSRFRGSAQFGHDYGTDRVGVLVSLALQTDSISIQFDFPSRGFHQWNRLN